MRPGRSRFSALPGTHAGVESMMSLPVATLVTGGSSGIGRAICEMLLADGVTQVVNVDYAEPGWSHPNMTFFQADLTDAAATRAVGEQVTQRFAVTRLVNNAGATRPGTIDSATLDDLDYVVGLHLQASMLLIQACLPAMRAAGFGRIVQMASRAALGKTERVVYSATKAGMIGMARTLAMELGGDGITVNSVAPGPIATELFRRSNPRAASAPGAFSPASRSSAWERRKTRARRHVLPVARKRLRHRTGSLCLRRNHAGRGARLKKTATPRRPAFMREGGPV